MQRRAQTLEGLLVSSEKQYLTRLHQNAQRLLRPLKVVNPYAEQLTFLSDKTRTRRDHMKYLTLIQAVALLHQYQRAVKRTAHRDQVIEYIEVQPSDIRLANRLAHEVLGRTLDEMPPQTRKLLVLLREMATGLAASQNGQPSEMRFTRRARWRVRRLGGMRLRIIYSAVVNGSRRKKPGSMALMFSPVVIILPVKPVSGGRLKIKLMQPH